LPNYTFHIKHLFFILLLLGNTSKSFSKDTLYFYNKAILVGELKKITLGKIQFDADGVGIVNIKVDKVKTFRADTRSFRVETTDKQLMYGKIEESAMQGFISIINENSRKEININHISSLSAFGNQLATRISGRAGAGYSYARSTQIGRLNLNGTTKYVTSKSEFNFDGSMMVTTDSVTTFREREQAVLSGIFYLNNQLYTGINISYQRNRELGLKSRLQQGLGVGYKLIQKQKADARAITGFVLNTEENYSNVRSSLYEWVLQGKFDFFSFSDPNIVLSTTQTAFVSLSQKGRHRFDGDLSLNWELIKDFSLNFSFYYNYDSKSPANGKSKIDYGFVSGLSYSF
jgi:hypothetical protein